MSISVMWIGKQPINDFINTVYLPLQKRVGGEIGSPRAKAMAVGKKALNDLSKLVRRAVAGTTLEIEAFSQAISVVELAFDNIIARKQTNSHKSLISEIDINKLRGFVATLRTELKVLIDITLNQSATNSVSSQPVVWQENEKEHYANQAAYDAVYEMGNTHKVESPAITKINFDPTLEALSAKVQSLTAQLAGFVSANTVSSEQQAKLHEVTLRGLAEQQETSMILIKRLDSLEAGFQRIENVLLANQQSSAIDSSAVQATEQTAQPLELASILKKSIRTPIAQAIAPNDSNLILPARGGSAWSVLGWGVSTAACGSSAGASILGAAGSTSAMGMLLSSSDWAMLASLAVSASILSFYQLTKVFIQCCVPAAGKLLDEVSFKKVSEQVLNSEDVLSPNEKNGLGRSEKHPLGVGHNAINSKLGSRLSTKASSRLARRGAQISVNRPVAPVKKSPLGQYSITPTVDAQQLTERLAEQAKTQSQADLERLGKLIS